MIRPCTIFEKRILALRRTGILDRDARTEDRPLRFIQEEVVTPLRIDEPPLNLRVRVGVVHEPRAPRHVGLPLADVGERISRNPPVPGDHEVRAIVLRDGVIGRTLAGLLQSHQQCFDDPHRDTLENPLLHESLTVRDPERISTDIAPHEGLGLGLPVPVGVRAILGNRRSGNSQNESDAYKKASYEVITHHPALLIAATTNLPSRLPRTK